MNGIANSGSAACGGLSFRAAVLHVSAPFGSTVSISKGGVVAKSLGPGRAHMNSDGINADYYFSIIPSNYGAWTVEASLGDDVASAVVEVATNLQYDVEIGYRVPAAYQAIEWLETSNGAYFDTGIIPVTTNYTTKVKIQVAVTNGGYPFGVEGGYGMRKPNGYSQLYYKYDNGETYFTLSGIDTVGKEFEIVYNAAGGAVIVDGVQKAAHQNIKALSNRQYSILVSAGRYGAGVQNWGHWRYIDFAVMERDTQNLLCDYRPCYRKSDNVCGFWDAVSKTFVTQLGTGSITAGPDL